MVIEKIGKLPVNSRITIDYTKSPVQIDFGYPDPDASAIRKSDGVFLPAIFIGTIMFIILFALWSFIFQPMIYPNISTKDTTINNVTISQFQYPNGTLYGLDKLYIEYTWNNKSRLTKLYLDKVGIIWIMPYFSDEGNGTATTMAISIQLFLMIGIWIGLIILNTFWIAKVFTGTNWGNRKYPELNKLIYDAKFSAEFFPKDFPANNIIEIPLFKNMYMDYEATGDFAEQLQKISIIEHPFNRLIRKGIPFSKRKHITKKINVYLWKCVVEFKGKPKDGQLTLKWT